MENKMWTYIDEQKDVLLNILDQEEKTLSSLPKEFINKKEIIITASGSSLNAAMLVKAMLERKMECIIHVETPFQLRYYSPLLLSYNENKLLIALSQTGKSTGTLECLTLAKENHIPTIAMTADDKSPIASCADTHINILCGEELVGPKTKGFTATVITLQLVLMKLSLLSSHQVIEEYRQSINELPQNIQDSKKWCEGHKEWAKAKAMSIVGFGVHYPTAREGTLKILETMQIPIMNFDMEEFMHGPHRTIVEDSYLIMIDTKGAGQTLMHNLIDFSKTKTDYYLIISTMRDENQQTIHVGDYPMTSSWLNIVVIFQVLCTYFPEINGMNSSDPIYGDFATTVGTRIA
ncbi:SIS domain-containing protein [Candidatus Stoquefichus sp. SB1]|uniref:SIS domain-containing protein n=1 Tax=Candidatus Stoquefichus sp. SB1 TaxID=1658109 RepID=UPI00067EFD43|nr:SIS domain-containing protein [Candidatus Stoquefichus sp. SB1]